MKTGDIVKVKDIGESLQFISDSQDVEPMNEEYGEDYDSYFIEQAEGCILQVFGVYGIVPYLEKDTYKVV